MQDLAGSSTAIAQTLIISIPNFIQKDVGKKKVFFTLDIVCDQSKWSIQKRYSEFDDLNKELNKKYVKLPKLPGKTLLKLKSQDGIQKRRIGLEEYIKDIAKRKDILKDQHFRDFLQLDMHSNAIYANPLKLSECSNPLGVRDFLYVQNENMLFVSLSDMEVTSRIDAYLTNYTFPWEKKTDSHVTVGAIVSYRLNIDRKNEHWEFERLWTKSYPVQTECLYWEQELNLLAVGMDDGKIHTLKVTKDLNFMQYEEVTSTKAHSARVMGIGIDSKRGYIYSAGEDKKFKIFDLNSGENVIGQQIQYLFILLSKNSDLQPAKSKLKNLIFDKPNSRIFLTSGQGQIFIYSIQTHPPKQLVSVNTFSKSVIRGLFINFRKNYIFTTSMDGSISCFELGKPGKEKFLKQVATMKGKEKCRCVCWNSKHNEIMAGNQNGKVTIWSTKTGEPLYVLDSHTKAITQMLWLQERQILLTGGKDKKLRIWRIPQDWTNPSAFLPSKQSAPASRFDNDDESKEFNFDSDEDDIMVKPPMRNKNSNDDDDDDYYQSKPQAFEKKITSTDESKPAKKKKKIFDDDDDDLEGWHL